MVSAATISVLGACTPPPLGSTETAVSAGSVSTASPARPAQVSTTVGAPSLSSTPAPSVQVEARSLRGWVAYREGPENGLDVLLADPDTLQSIALGLRPLNPGPPAWSPDWTQLAFIGTDNAIYIIDLSCVAQSPISCLDGAVKLETGAPDTWGYVTWSPTGDSLLYGRLEAEPSEGSLMQLTLVDLSQRKLPTQGAGRIDWSSDGKLILSDSTFASALGGMEQAQARVFSLLDGTTSNLLPEGAHLPNSASPKWSPDGTSVVFMTTFGRGFSAGASYDIFVARSDGFNPKLVASDALDADWSPDGRSLVFEREEGLFIVELATGSERRIVSLPSLHPAPFPAWSP